MSIAVAPAAARPLPATQTSTRPGVPWTGVVLLAVAMAYADGFWLTSLRGAVGVVGRSQGPFATWWRESTVVLPVFVLAVLAAMTLALRWFGPVVRLRTTLATAVLVILSGSIVGIGQLAVSSAYDYRLQAQQLHAMAQMSGSCLDGCLDRQQQETLAVHVHAVGFVSQWVVLTNAVLVAWVVALLGGRLRLRTDGQPGVGPVTALRRERDVRVLTAVALAGAAAIHVAVIPEHLGEWAAAGGFFALLAVGELAAAGLLVARPGRPAALAAAVISVVPLLVWAWSRTAGLPFGPEAGTPEAMGVPDGVAGALESVALVGAALLFRDSQWLRRPRVSTHLTSLAFVAVLAAVAIGVVASGAVWPDVFTHPGAASAAH